MTPRLCLIQRKHKSGEYDTERVVLTYEEAFHYLQAHITNYPEGCRIVDVPAEGALVTLLRQLHQPANRERRACG